MKFICNWRSVLELILVEECFKDVKMLDLSYDNFLIEWVFGVKWCVEFDIFKFCIIVKDKFVMRRGILFIVLFIYDFFGFVVLFILIVKKLF